MKKIKLVMVGNGMTGVRTLEELLKLNSDFYDITVFGAEPHPNYNRILLSPVLAGEQTFEKSSSTTSTGMRKTASSSSSTARWCRSTGSAAGWSPRTAARPSTTACCWPPARSPSSCRYPAIACRA